LRLKTPLENDDGRHGIEVAVIFGSLTKFGSKKWSYMDISTLGYIQKGGSYFWYYSYVKIPQLSCCCLAAV
jgi:hypothetical protein